MKAPLSLELENQTNPGNWVASWIEFKAFGINLVQSTYYGTLSSSSYPPMTKKLAHPVKNTKPMDIKAK